MIRSRQPRPATSSSPRPLALSPLTYTYPPIHCLPSLPRTRRTRHNSTRTCRRNPCAINIIHTLSVTHGGVPLCPLPILNFPLLTALFAPVPVSVPVNVIPRHLPALCFHALTHSFAPHKTLSPAFSIICALFPENTRGGGYPRSATSSCRGLLLSNVIRRARAAGSTACL
jgi:hypothetical protein